jgi:hypothetical protein
MHRRFSTLSLSLSLKILEKETKMVGGVLEKD